MINLYDNTRAKRLELKVQLNSAYKCTVREWDLRRHCDALLPYAAAPKAGVFSSSVAEKIGEQKPPVEIPIP